MRIVYRDTRFINHTEDRSFLTEVIVERLSQERVSLSFGVCLPVKLGEHLVDDTMCLHGAFDLLRPGVVAVSPSLEVVVELFELVDVVFAEPDARRRGRVSHTSRLAGEAVKSGGNAA